jgi:SAM-dependent methyltransferase
MTVVQTRSRTVDAPPPTRGSSSLLPDDAAAHRRAERAWQDSTGQELLDLPYRLPGSAAWFRDLFDRLADELRDLPPGPVLEVGCGKGHLLRHIRSKPWLVSHALVGIDLSRAVFAVPAPGVLAIGGDGERLPLRAQSVAAVLYNGSLHHVIDYAEAVREAERILVPGGRLVLLEPFSSRFSRLVHRTLDPLVFRQLEYESPIDQLYKQHFHEYVVVAAVAEKLVVRKHARTDFLAYPLTGCYAGSLFARSARFMRAMMALERAISAIPGLRRLAAAVAWRFLIVAEKPGS